MFRAVFTISVYIFLSAGGSVGGSVCLCVCLVKLIEIMRKQVEMPRDVKGVWTVLRESDAFLCCLSVHLCLCILLCGCVSASSFFCRCLFFSSSQCLCISVHLCTNVLVSSQRELSVCYMWTGNYHTVHTRHQVWVSLWTNRI